MSNVESMNAPISHLPPEILLEIMLTYKHIVEEEWQLKNQRDPLERPWYLSPTYKWFKITFLCRRWRTLALSYPVLWASIHIPYANLGWVDELLKRSHPAPISTLSLKRERYSVDISTHISPFSGNHGKGRSIRRLHVELSRVHLDWNPSDLSTLVLNDVKELTICRRTASRYSSLHPPKVFIDFFATCSFKLESLILACSIWDKRYLHDTLTTLVLEGTHQVQPMNWDEFIFTLGTMKKLRDLCLHEVLCRLSPSTTVQPIHITLPQLNSLILREDDLAAHVKFLESVSVPHGTNTSLRNSTNSIDEYISAIPLFSRVLSHSPPSLPHRYLELDLRFDRGHVNFHVAVETDIPAAYGLSRSRRHNPNLVRCHVPNCVQPLDAFQRTSELVGSLPLNHIKTIYVTGVGVDLSLILCTLASLPMLDTLEIMEELDDPCTSLALVSAFPACSDGCADRTSTPSYASSCEDCKTAIKGFFPALRTLRYLSYGAEFCEKKEQQDYCLSLIRKFVSYMASDGRKLTQLEFCGYGRDGLEGWNERLALFCDDIAWVSFDDYRPKH